MSPVGTIFDKFENYPWRDNISMLFPVHLNLRQNLYVDLSTYPDRALGSAVKLFDAIFLFRY